MFKNKYTPKLLIKSYIAPCCVIFISYSSDSIRSGEICENHILFHIDFIFEQNALEQQVISLDLYMPNKNNKHSVLIFPFHIRLTC